jgi:hypothetical protein
MVPAIDTRPRLGLDFTHHHRSLPVTVLTNIINVFAGQLKLPVVIFFLFKKPSLVFNLTHPLNSHVIIFN